MMNERYDPCDNLPSTENVPDLIWYDRHQLAQCYKTPKDILIILTKDKDFRVAEAAGISLGREWSHDTGSGDNTTLICWGLAAVILLGLICDMLYTAYHQGRRK